MLAFLTAQVLIAAYAFLMAQKESNAVRAFRDYVPHNNPYTDPYHWTDAIATGIVLISLSIFQPSVLGHVLAPVVCALVYWVVFDVVIGDEVYDNPYYIGTTARIDKFLFQGFDVKVWFVRLRWTGFGKNAGKRKVQYALGGVVLLNLLYLFV